MSKTMIEEIQEDDPSYDPLALALSKTEGVDKSLWDAATDRVYFDGYYGPISPDEWKEQDGRKPYSVNEAFVIIIKVLDNVEDYKFNDDWDSVVEANEIKADLLHPWYREIYGTRFPS